MKKILNELAERHGVSPESIENDIHIAISMAMGSHNPEAREFWNRISPDGKEPPLELLLYALSVEAIQRLGPGPEERAS